MKKDKTSQIPHPILHPNPISPSERDPQTLTIII